MLAFKNKREIERVINLIKNEFPHELVSLVWLERKVLVILEDITPEILKRFYQFKKKLRKVSFDFYLITFLELSVIARVFPQEIWLWKNKGEVLFGRNPFAGIDIPKEAIEFYFLYRLFNEMLNNRKLFIRYSFIGRKEMEASLKDIKAILEQLDSKIAYQFNIGSKRKFLANYSRLVFLLEQILKEGKLLHL